VAKNGNDVGATFDFVEATFDFVKRIVRLVAFDNVASTLLLVWKGLYRCTCLITQAGWLTPLVDKHMDGK